MRALNIGGTSFIGPHLVAQLLSAGHKVTIFHRGQTDNLPWSRETPKGM